jgi:hypothetical protein
MRPEKGSYPGYYENYIPLVQEGDLLSALTHNLTLLQTRLRAVPAEKENYAYAEGKWTVKQLVMHLIDTERVFAYRALRFARKDPQQPLPFNENDYAAAADVSDRDLASLLEELESVRQSSIFLFRHLSPDVLLRSGQTAAGATTVLAIGFTICGHAIHHLNVLSERYLKK